MKISEQSQPASSFATLPPAQVCSKVINRLTGKEHASDGCGYFSVPAEEDIIRLLCNSETASAVRAAAIDGCVRVILQLMNKIADSESYITYEFESTLRRVCEVLDVAHPEELCGLSFALVSVLNTVSKRGRDDANLASAVRAAAGYTNEVRAHVPFWESLLESNPSVTAYSFNTLLRVVPFSSKIPIWLHGLWRKKLECSWDVDVPFLMRRAVRVLGDGIIHQMLWYGSHESFWPKMREELKRRDWSKAWLDEFDKSNKNDSLCSKFMIELSTGEQKWMD